MRSETRSVRPFFKLPPEVLECLNQAEIRLPGEESFIASESLSSSSDIVSGTLSIRFPGLSEAGGLLPSLTDSLGLKVVLWDDSQRIAEVIFAKSLKHLSDLDEVSFTANASKANWNGHRGAKISLYLALDEDAVQSAGMPYKTGHILSMKHFSVNKSSSGPDFPIEFWTDEQFLSAGFRLGTAAAVVGDTERLRESDPDELNLKIAISERIRSQLSRASSDRIGNALRQSIKTMLFAQLIQICKEMKDLDPDSCGRNFLNKICAEVGLTAAEIENMEVPQIAAISQEFSGVTKVFSEIPA